jgi:hypothetical protein
MKDFKKKFDQFMLKSGGYALLVATIATVSFFAILQWANDYVKEKTGELEISLDENGAISVDYNYDDKEDVYILWETDGGMVKSDSTTDLFKESQKDEQNKGYYCYTLSNGKVYWDSKDADGNNYSTATIRAVLYEKDENNIYKIENYVTEVTITLTMQDGKIKKAENRLFSNPIREDSDEKWSQIYCINESEKNNTYRYRTGEKIDKDKVLILCWQSDKEDLSETDYANGIYPECTVVEKNSNKELLKAVTMITCSKEKIEEGNLQAYLIDEESYQKTILEEKDKINIAKISK